MEELGVAERWELEKFNLSLFVLVYCLIFLFLSDEHLIRLVQVGGEVQPLPGVHLDSFDMVEPSFFIFCAYHADADFCMVYLGDRGVHLTWS